MDSRIHLLIAASRLHDDINAATAARQAKELKRTRRREPRPVGRRFIRHAPTLPIR
jgi:hypothetical protein